MGKIGVVVLGALVLSCGGGGTKAGTGPAPDMPGSADPQPPDTDGHMPEAAAAGSAIFDRNCAGCHRGADRKGPELVAGYNNRQWIRGFLTDPRADGYFGRLDTKKFKMKAIKQTGADLDALVEFVYGQTGAPDADAELAKKGEDIFDDGNCSNCHSNDDDSEGDVGPNLKDRGTINMLSRFIADPNNRRWFGKKNKMDAFGRDLTDKQLDQVARYLTWLRGDGLD